MDRTLPALRGRRQARPPSGHCSCDLLLGLASHPKVRDFFASLGLPSEQLAQVRRNLHHHVESEPADWYLRLQQREAGAQAEPELSRLLAISRSPDCHAYKLIERSGLSVALLRKKLIEHLRSLGCSRAETLPVALPDLPASATSPRRPRRRSQMEAPELVEARGKQGIIIETRLEQKQPIHGSPSEVSSPEFEDASFEASEFSGPRSSATSPTELHPIANESLPPIAGRQVELAKLTDALQRRGNRAPVLVGEHGSGRSLVATHLAGLLKSPVYSLSLCNYDDDEQLKADLDEVSQKKGVAILDDFDRCMGDTAPLFLSTLARAWAQSNPVSLTILSPEALSQLQLWMPGIRDTLDLIFLSNLSPQEEDEALYLASGPVLAHHGVQACSKDELFELSRLARRHLTGLAMPGRAIDLLDLAAARSQRQHENILRPETWIQVASERSGLSVERLCEQDGQKLLQLDEQLRQRIVGHENALTSLARLIRRNRAGFGGDRPIASALLLGPSGIGKTEIAKALAEALFDGERSLVRLDMSEYSEAHAVARIVGAPPGYVGHEQGGALSDPLLAQPHCVVLLDEIEKAHRSVHQLLLQVFDEGLLTDGRGRKVDFRHCVLVMTSNLGSDHLGEVPDSNDDEILSIAREAFPVEVWNRIEAPLVLRPLSKNNLDEICKRLIEGSSARLCREREIQFSLDRSARNYLLRMAGKDPTLGARPLRHLIAREVESRIADAILAGEFVAGDIIQVSESSGELVTSSRKASRRSALNRA